MKGYHLFHFNLNITYLHLGFTQVSQEAITYLLPVVWISLNLLVVSKKELHGGGIIGVGRADDEVDADLLQDLPSVRGGVVFGPIHEPDGVPPPFLGFGAEYEGKSTKE